MLLTMRTTVLVMTSGRLTFYHQQVGRYDLTQLFGIDQDSGSFSLYVLNTPSTKMTV